MTAVLLALLTRIGPVALPVWTDWLGLTGGALLGRVARFAVARLPSTWLEGENG